MVYSREIAGNQRALELLTEQGFRFRTPLSGIEISEFVARIYDYARLGRVPAEVSDSFSSTTLSPKLLGEVVCDLLQSTPLDERIIGSYLIEVKEGRRKIPGVLETVNYFGYPTLKREVLLEQLNPFLTQVKSAYEETPNTDLIADRINQSDPKLMGSLGVVVHVVPKDVDLMITDAYRRDKKLGRFHLPSLNEAELAYLDSLLADSKIFYREAVEAFTARTGMHATHRHLIRVKEARGIDRK